MSFIRKPPVSDSAGNPPCEASNTPGVVDMKLIVAVKSAIASRLPPIETFGHHGRTASSDGRGDLEDAEQVFFCVDSICWVVL